MTDQQAPAAGAGEQWEKVPFPEWQELPDIGGRHLRWIVRTVEKRTVNNFVIAPARIIAMCFTEADADAILAAHEQAQRVRELEAALRFYALRSRYFHEDEDCPEICEDEGERARQLVGDPDDALLAPGPEVV